MIRKSYAAIIKFLWRWYANLSGLSLISLAVGYTIVAAASGSAAVFTATDVRVKVASAKAGGTIEYTYDQRRVEECPGTVVQVFSSIAGSERILREQRRPVVFTKAQVYDDLHVRVNLPPDLPPGKYRFQDFIVSQCPLRERTDQIADFPIEVTK